MPCNVKTGILPAVSIILEAPESEAKEELLKVEVGEKFKNLLNLPFNDSDLDEETNQDNNTVDATVTFARTWAKRGFTFGAFFVMSIDTGELLDYHIYHSFVRRVHVTRV